MKTASSIRQLDTHPSFVDGRTSDENKSNDIICMQKSCPELNTEMNKPMTTWLDFSNIAINTNEYQQKSSHITVSDQSVDLHIGINMLSENQQMTRQIDGPMITCQDTGYILLNQCSDR